MALIGRLHPLLIHFPIVLALAAVAAEAAGATERGALWRGLAAAHIRVAAPFAVLAAAAGWQFAGEPGFDAFGLLEWHRWIGTAAAVAAVAAAVASVRVDAGSRPRLVYRLTLLAAALLVAIAGHLGGLLVWGDGFFRP